MNKLIAVVGTNASGKSGLGVRLAEKFGGEIVSADSRQVYRGLDLGSGKIEPENTHGIRHHLLDVVEPNDFFSMADFQKLAYAAIDDIAARGKQPFLVGGTGLYVASVTEGYLLSDKMPDLEYRNELEKLPTPELYEMLLKVMPDTQVDGKNRNRVMRILEKLHDGDDAVPKAERRYDVLKLGVHWPREILRDRIDVRLKRRMDAGMVDEVRRLKAEGATDEFLMKLGLEYRYLDEYLNGVWGSEEEMVHELSLAIKRFAKRQETWFRRDNEIHWLDMEADPFAQASELIESFLEKGE